VFKYQLTAQLPLQKPNPDILVAECSNVHRWLTGIMVHPSQGVRQQIDGCKALGYSKAATALLCRTKRITAHKKLLALCGRRKLQGIILPIPDSNTA